MGCPFHLVKFIYIDVSVEKLPNPNCYLWFSCVHPIQVLLAHFKVEGQKGKDSHTESAPCSVTSLARQRGELQKMFMTL